MAEQKKILLVDFDDTICQSVFLKKVNDFLGTDYKIEQFKEYLIDSIVPEDRRKEFFASFFETDPYEKLPLIDGAKEALKKLSKKYDIYVCSSCVMLNSPKSSARLFSSKYEYLIKNLPFLDPKKFIFTSSNGVYGSAYNPPFVEDLHPMPDDPYAISKYAIELDLKKSWILL